MRGRRIRTPGFAVSAWPFVAVPQIVGAEVFTGAVAAPATRLVALEIAVPALAEFVP